MSATIGRVRAVFSASTSGLTGGISQAAGSVRKMVGSVASLKGGLSALSVVSRVKAVFTASTSGLTGGINSASASIRKMQGSISSLKGGLSLLTMINGAQLFGSIASSASSAVRSLLSMGSAQAEVIDTTSKLASRLGMTYAELSGLAYAGDLAGVGIDTIAKAATKLDVAMVQAVNGSETAIAKFTKLKLSVADLNGMNAEQRFHAIAQAISQLPNEAEKAAAAIRLFGPAGAAMLPMFKDGAKGLQELAVESEKFGRNLTNAQGVDVENMNDAFTRAQKAISGVVQQLVAYLAPAVDAITTAFSDMIGSVGGATIGQSIGDGIMSGARFMAQIADYVIANFSDVFTYFQAVGMKFGAVWDVAGRVVAFLSGVGNILKTVFLFAASSLGSIVANLLIGVKNAGEFMGFDMAGMESSIAAMQAFSTTAFEGSAAAAGDAVKNFEDAFGESAPTWGTAAVGPVTAALDAQLAKAKASAAAIDKASAPTGIVKQEIKVEVVKKQETQGIESRSAEGIKEMFRLMRGPTEADDIAKQQLQVLENIADNTEDAGGADVDEYDLAPAAGA